MKPTEKKTNSGQIFIYMAIGFCERETVVYSKAELYSLTRQVFDIGLPTITIFILLEYNWCSLWSKPI